ncbi:TMV resistance protein [Vigna angularis]|uniref:TMV resistance protein n=1 Tax=Phaseolus angularis TaxID=3914 RepID=A0A8T0JF65_PHAAN|nr:TMV resistance protein [Vigna angularis]
MSHSSGLDAFTNRFRHALSYNNDASNINKPDFRELDLGSPVSPLCTTRTCGEYHNARWPEGGADSHSDVSSVSSPASVAFWFVRNKTEAVIARTINFKTKHLSVDEHSWRSCWWGKERKATFEGAFMSCPNLKRIDLSNSKYLSETPDFSRIIKLERLDLSGCSSLSYVHSSIGFGFYVIFSPHSSFSSPYSSHPLYLSFESEYTEEYFDMRFNSERDECFMSRHIWIIYISREHCHFVKTGAHITFKAQPNVKIDTWGMRPILKQDIRDIGGKKYIAFSHSNDNRVDFEYVEKSNSGSGPKIQLPYNWYVTEEEQVENIDAKAKENNLSNAGL